MAGRGVHRQAQPEDAVAVGWGHRLLGGEGNGAGAVEHLHIELGAVHPAAAAHQGHGVGGVVEVGEVLLLEGEGRQAGRVGAGLAEEVVGGEQVLVVELHVHGAQGRAGGVVEQQLDLDLEGHLIVSRRSD